jgi:hypothetical protein
MAVAVILLMVGKKYKYSGEHTTCVALGHKGSRLMCFGVWNSKPTEP